ncbi:MAG: (S)-ureidoglycine aminohydrolase [Planctomycetota bacterium]
MTQLPLGRTRTQVNRNHAIIAPDGYVVSPLHGWTETEGVMLISPAMGVAVRGPRFAMYLANLTSDSCSRTADPGVQRLIYVLDGAVSVGGDDLSSESFAYLPPGDDSSVNSSGSARLLVFEKPYVSLDGTPAPEKIVGHLSERSAEPFMGDENARLATLLPVEPAFDMAVNVFTFDPGTPLPFVETHIMEHGLYMSQGQGVYRLGENWYPVTKGDSIWMAAYCPQWFVAMGREPAQYIYYKDVHRSHLS